MSTDGACAPIGELRGRALDRCSRCFPWLADPARRSSLGLKVSLVALHLVYAGFLFLFDKDLIEKTRREPWYIALYLLLFVAALIQYFITAGSSPGYVLDAMKTFHEANSLFMTNPTASNEDILLRAKMVASLGLWITVSQEETLLEVVLGQRW